MKAKYRFLLIAAKIFKVFGWIALVLGVIFSILMGVGVGVGMGMGTAIPWLGGFGAFYTIFGILYSVMPPQSGLIAFESRRTTAKR